jgi:predicted phage terminase large subunit-like protein
MSASLDYLKDRDGLYKELVERSLKHFIEQAWPIVEPAYDYRSNWHIDAICDHLQAVRNSEIQQLLINVSPRCMKSLTCAVFFPAWVWTEEPVAKYLYSSYAQSLSTRDSMKMRRLVKSKWYQDKWKITFEQDENNKTKYQNQYTGYRLATSVGGMNTGEGGDYIFADDPHNVIEGESDAKRKAAIEWWDESMSSRLNDPKTGRRVVIMQRVHEVDLAGHLIESGDWVHLCLPMEFNPKKKCFIEVTGFEDPRTEDGELMWPSHIGPKERDRLEKNLRAYGWAGQYNQDPIPRKGTMLDVDLIEVRISPSAKIKKVLRCWDKAGTEGAGARTAGVKGAILANGRFCILDVKKGQWAASKRNKVMKQTAVLDGKKVRIWIEQEGGSGGKESAENSVKELAGYRAYAESPKGDKEMRAEPFAIQIAANNVEVIRGDWTDEYLEEVRKFPVGKFKDQVDATSLLLKKLTDTGGKVHVG